MVEYDGGDFFRRSSYCGSGACVEVAPRDGVIAVRDSKNPGQPELRFTHEEWRAFIQGAKDCEFDFVEESATIRFTA